MNNEKTALVFGATGLVGDCLLQQLIKGREYTKIKIFVRKPISLIAAKVEQHIVDFSNLQQYQHLVNGTHLYCCVGTTIAKAGSQEAFRAVDYQIPTQLAAIAKQNGVQRFLVVSSIGANAQSSNFYLRTKGEMERDVYTHFKAGAVFAQPSLLLGKRSEQRFGETVGKVFAAALNPLMMGSLKKYRGIQAHIVAAAMIKIANQDNIKPIYMSDELQEIGS